MTDTCTPPAGTPDGTWHYLAHETGQRFAAMWCQTEEFTRWAFDKECSISRAPGQLIGWRYIGPVEPKNATIEQSSIVEDEIRHAKTCPACGAPPCDQVNTLAPSPAIEDFAAVNAKLSANQQPLGTDFEKVWDDNAAALYEGQDAPSPEPLEEVATTQRGYTIWRQPNRAGGHSYWSDAIACGAMIYDSCITGLDEMREVLRIEYGIDLPSESAAPSPADALLREALEWLGVETPLSGPSLLKLDALCARIRQHLGKK